MRQREIERIEKRPVTICRENKHSDGSFFFWSAAKREKDELCMYLRNETCEIDNRKCDAVKFQLKEVKDGAEV